MEAIRKLALWFGAFNLALGLAAFAGPLVGGNDQPVNLGSGQLLGFLAVNWAHALIHVVFGLYGLSARRSTAAAIGALAGAVALGWLGWALAAGAMPVAGLGQWAAAGPGVGAFTGAGLGIAAGGLAGALIALFRLPAR